MPDPQPKNQAAEELAEPLMDLPPIEFAFAYGSAVFQQHHTSTAANSSNGKRNKDVPQTDYILGVAAPAEWHTENLERNPRHYASLLARFGGPAVSAVAERVGVGVHFNTLVPWREKVIKYGVIHTERLVQDVLAWNALYVSGRLQKPVCVLVDEVGVNQVNRVNLQSALAAALLQLPEAFTSEELYREICHLSYRGDIRMLFAEDPRKVLRIVRGSFSELERLYAAPARQLAGSGRLLEVPSDGHGAPSSVWRQDVAPTARQSLVSALPAGVLARLAPCVSIAFDPTADNQSEVAQEIVHALVTKGEHYSQHVLRKSIAGIVRASSFRQAVSGVLAAGGMNAVQYVGRKMGKAWRSR